MLKTWHMHGNTPHGGADFYPLLAEVGKGIIQGEYGSGMARKRGAKGAIYGTVQEQILLIYGFKMKNFFHLYCMFKH
jgi:hypothetical protein